MPSASASLSASFGHESPKSHRPSPSASSPSFEASNDPEIQSSHPSKSESKQINGFVSSVSRKLENHHHHHHHQHQHKVNHYLNH